MGLMLTFMFVMNMFGALILLPALVHFLIPIKKYASREVTQDRMNLARGEQPIPGSPNK
jgi:hypothetical protein